jgi:hypothetical protein
MGRTQFRGTDEKKIYLEQAKKQNGLIFSHSFVDDATEMNRNEERIILVKLVVPGRIMNSL